MFKPGSRFFFWIQIVLTRIFHGTQRASETKTNGKLNGHVHVSIYFTTFFLLLLFAVFFYGAGIDVSLLWAMCVVCRFETQNHCRLHFCNKEWSFWLIKMKAEIIKLCRALDEHDGTRPETWCCPLLREKTFTWCSKWKQIANSIWECEVSCLISMRDKGFDAVRWNMFADEAPFW